MADVNVIPVGDAPAHPSRRLDGFGVSEVEREGTERRREWWAAEVERLEGRVQGLLS